MRRLGKAALAVTAFLLVIAELQVQEEAERQRAADAIYATVAR